MSFHIETIKIVHLKCERCGKSDSYTNIRTVKDARSYGWGISKDYRKCYCPDCAPKYRNVGMAYGGVCSWR